MPLCTYASQLGGWSITQPLKSVFAGNDFYVGVWSQDVSRVSIRFGYSKSSLWLEGVLGSEGGFGESPKTDTSVSNGLEAYIYFESAED